MYIYGTAEMIHRLRSIGAADPKIQKILSQDPTCISDLSSLRTAVRQHGSEGILLLDPLDTAAIRSFYQDGIKNIFLPAGSEILSVQDPEADLTTERMLSGCRDWNIHKAVNRFRMIRSVLNRSDYFDSLPMHIQLEHTSFCNAECIMCGHALYGNRGAIHISEKMLERIRSLLPTCELMVLHGYGEPLLTKDLDRILDMYGKYNIEVTTNTNLSYLPDALLEHLVPVVRHLRISCDAVIPDIYEKIRGGLHFNTFEDNLKKLRNRAPDIELLMETVIMRQNIEQLPQMVRFASRYGFSQISFNRLGAHPALQNEKDCLNLYPHLTDHYLKAAVEEGAKLGIRVIFPRDWLLPERAEDDSAMEEELRIAHSLPFRAKPKDIHVTAYEYAGDVPYLDAADTALLAGKYLCSGTCDSLAGRTYIDLFGNVFSCCMNTRVKVGNIFEQSDSDIFNSPALRKLREQFYCGTVPRYCDNCSYVMNRSMALADIFPAT